MKPFVGLHRVSKRYVLSKIYAILCSEANARGKNHTEAMFSPKLVQNELLVDALQRALDPWLGPLHPIKLEGKRFQWDRRQCRASIL